MHETLISDSMTTVNPLHEMTDAGYSYRTGWEAVQRRHNSTAALQMQSFGGLEDNFIMRASELANDMKVAQTSLFLRPPDNLYSLDNVPLMNAPRAAHQMTNHVYGSMSDNNASFEHSSAMNIQAAMMAQHHHHHEQQQQQNAAAAAAAAAAVSCCHSRMVAYSSSYPSISGYSNPSISMASTPSNAAAAAAMMCAPHSLNLSPHYSMTSHVNDLDYDPRELEAFSERFKQRRIKLSVTQADVGKALGNLKLPGVGCLSQSTICRFESLTLSHNNMIALKPVLQAWLEEEEQLAAERIKNPDIYGDSIDSKRKRTSITDAEKRSLEAYFTVQPRPSSEKITQIAEKLNLKKNVVRVWFCNQRQKQKRMKFASPHLMSHSGQTPVSQ